MSPDFMWMIMLFGFCFSIRTDFKSINNCKKYYDHILFVGLHSIVNTCILSILYV